MINLNQETQLRLKPLKDPVLFASLKTTIYPSQNQD